MFGPLWASSAPLKRARSADVEHPTAVRARDPGVSSASLDGLFPGPPSGGGGARSGLNQQGALGQLRGQALELGVAAAPSQLA